MRFKTEQKQRIDNQQRSQLCWNSVEGFKESEIRETTTNEYSERVDEESK